jgi:hypothetical protein
VTTLKTSRNCAIALRQVVEQPRHCSVRGREIGGDGDEMEVCFDIDNRAAYGDADGSAEHHVEEPAGVFQPFRRQAGEAKIDGWRNRKDLWQTAKDLGDQELVRAPVVGNKAVTPHSNAERRKTEHHQPANVESLGEKDVNGNPNQRRRAGREGGDAGLPGAETADIAEKRT